MHGRVIASGTPRKLIASLGGEHVIEFTAEHRGLAKRNHRPTLANLPAVTAARAENRHISLSVVEPHVALPALLEHLDKCAIPTNEPHHAARQPRRRIRKIGRTPFERRTDGLRLQTQST